MLQKMVRLGWYSLVILLLFSVTSALSASLTIPQSRVGYMTRTITVNDLKPSGCSALTLSAIVIGTGKFTNNTGRSALVLGGPGDDNITGGPSSDCILGGGGNDTINAKGGIDVVYGGPGSDILRAETCYRGPGTIVGDADINNGCTNWYP